jgi:ABC-2 type transport system permease protein
MRRRRESEVMFYQIALFEFRYLSGQPVFRATFLVLLLLAFAGVAIPSFEIGSGGNVYKNAPNAIALITLNQGVLFMFAAAAFVAGTIVRDDDSGFAGILRTTQISKFDYLYGRFVGSFGAIALVFLSVPLGVFLGSLSPTLDSAKLGSFQGAHYAYSYFFLALPTIFFTCAFLFAVATGKRSITWAYVALVGLLVVNVSAAIVIGGDGLRDLVSLIDPFGLQVYGSITRYWSTQELNANMPAMTGVLLANRLLFVGLGIVMLVLAYFLFKMEVSGAPSKKGKPVKASGANAQIAARALASPTHERQAAWSQVTTCTRFELAQIFKSPAFFVILLLGLAVSFVGLFFIEEGYGGRYYPVTRKVIEVLGQVFDLFPTIVAIYYAGELVWRDRERAMNLIIDATIAPNWVFVVPKIVAVALALFSILTLSVVTGMAVQVGQGVTSFELTKYLTWYILPFGIDMVLLAVLAVLCQALAPNKFVGWGLMVVYLIAMLFLPQAGLSDNLYLYGKTPQVLYSDMNGGGTAGQAATWFRLYWSAGAIMLVVLTTAMWRRGIEARLAPRLARIGQALSKPALLIAAGAAAIFIGSGAFIFTNTHIWNPYRATGEGNAYLGAYEKALLGYEALPMPVVTDVKLDVEIYPAQTKLVTKAVYRLKNDKGVPITQIHLKWNRQAVVVSAAIDGATLDERHKRFNYQIFKLNAPLQPGASVNLTYVSSLHQRGFKNDENTTQILANGTFVSNFEFAPQIGMKRYDLLVGRAERRAQGLPEDLKTPLLDDPRSRDENYAGFDFVSSDITITTSADQTPIAPGSLVSDTTANGRRTIHYVAKAPISNFFSLQSGRYAVKSKMHQGIKLDVYYHPQHGYNVDRMLDAMAASFSYYQANFGPYQYDYARVIEYPAYTLGAQAFAGTVPFSEALGFLANLKDPSQNDVITYVTAHEMAHQYWGGQLNAAKAEGAEVLTETLAQYSALMVYQKMYGPERAAKLSAFSLDTYLQGRSDETVEEVPVLKTFGRDYIHYYKGEMVMNLIANRLGEDKVNAALRSLLQDFPANRGAPYPTTRDLVGRLRAGGLPDQQALITDLFENITLYDLSVQSAIATRRADGRFDVRVTIDARKHYADGLGNEHEAPLRETVTVGAFTDTPQSQSFSVADVITYQRAALTSGRNQIRFIAIKRPTYVGVDPLYEFVDKRPDDNALVVAR